MASALDNGKRSQRKLLAAVVNGQAAVDSID
jgi:hypothetical protein